MNKSKPKYILFLLTIIICLFSFISICVAQEYVFDKIRATITIPETYTVLDEHSVDTLSDWLTKVGKIKEDIIKDFNQRGVLLQAWNEKGDSCIEVSAVKTELSKTIFDVDQRSPETRGTYRVSFHPNNDYADQGYDYKLANWKKTAKSGRWLILKYNHEVEGTKDYNAFARRTIKNGYEIAVEIKNFARGVTTQDNIELNKVWNTWKFTEYLPLTNVASASINILTSPPEETKSQKVKISGEATEGVQFTAVVMSLGSTTPDIIKVTANEKSKFEIPVVFAKQGVYLITLTANYLGDDINEWAFPVTYRETLLAVNFIAEPPKIVETEEFKIKGTAEKGATIQILLNNNTVTYKKVTADGKFAILIDSLKEGNNELVLVFSKKGLQNRRFKFEFERKLTNEQNDKETVKKSVKPTYASLNNKTDKYIGQTIDCTVYLDSMQKYNDSYLLKCAYIKKDKKYSSFIYIISDTMLDEALVGKRINVFAECLGRTSTVANEVSIEEDAPMLKLLVINYK